MRKLLFVTSLVLAPAALLAQATAATTASTHANATAATNATAQVPASFSASGRAQLEATYARAREHHVPQQLIEHRVAEGQAKGASEASILASSDKVEANMESAQQAMVKAGHHPSDAEVAGGASAMDRGVTVAQIGRMAAHSSDRGSLDVPFSVLTALSDQGVPTANAVAQVQSKLDAHASNAAITSLVTQAKAGVKIGGGL